MAADVGLLAQLGTGGMVVVLSLREMFRYLSEHKNGANGANGNGSAALELKIRDAVDDSLAKGIHPALQQHTELLTDIRDGIVKLVDRDSRR